MGLPSCDLPPSRPPHSLDMLNRNHSPSPIGTMSGLDEIMEEIVEHFFGGFEGLPADTLVPSFPISELTVSARHPEEIR